MVDQKSSPMMSATGELSFLIRDDQGTQANDGCAGVFVWT
jgi:hypothetical protein